MKLATLARAQEIYERHGVKVIGAWENADDTDETYLRARNRERRPNEDDDGVRGEGLQTSGPRLSLSDK